MISQNKSTLVVADEVWIPKNEENDSFSLKGDPIINSSYSNSVASENYNIYRDKFQTSPIQKNWDIYRGGAQEIGSWGF